MAKDVFRDGESDPFPFRGARLILRGSGSGGMQFEVHRSPIPPRSPETCPAPSLIEVAILLSHLRAMACAVYTLSHPPSGSALDAALIVEADVDFRLVGLWDLEGGTQQRTHTRRNALDAAVEALPADWGMLQLAVITTIQHFRRLKNRHDHGELVVPHSELVGSDGRNEGWSTAAYLISTRGARTMVEKYWPGGLAAALHHRPDGLSARPVPAVAGKFDFGGKGCLRADWLLFDGHAASTWVTSQPLLLFGAGSASKDHSNRLAGIQIASIRNILVTFYGYSKADVQAVTAANRPHQKLPKSDARNVRHRKHAPEANSSLGGTTR